MLNIYNRIPFKKIDERIFMIPYKKSELDSGFHTAKNIYLRFYFIYVSWDMYQLILIQKILMRKLLCFLSEVLIRTHNVELNISIIRWSSLGLKHPFCLGCDQGVVSIRFSLEWTIQAIQAIQAIDLTNSWFN